MANGYQIYGTINPQAVSSSLNRVLLAINQICLNHYMRPSFGYGQSGDFNASNQTFFPAIWVEPLQTKSINSIQGVRADQISLYVYALDRINKGDDNFQELHSNTRYMLETIVGYIRESVYTRYQYILIDNQDIIYDAVMRETDEYTNGWRCKLLLRVPNVYNPCNSPITTVSTNYDGIFNVVSAGVDTVLSNKSQIVINVIDAGVDEVVGTGFNPINVISAGVDTVLSNA